MPGTYREFAKRASVKEVAGVSMPTITLDCGFKDYTRHRLSG